jgi:hypothetical protein
MAERALRNARLEKPGFTTGRVGVLAVIAACAGCPGTLEDPGRFADASDIDALTPTSPLQQDAASAPGTDAASCPDVPTAIFETTCAKASCHDSKDKAQGLDLQSSGVASRLVGVQATEGSGLLIDPTWPSRSILYEKLTTTPPFGARMPLSGSLDDAAIACVLAWVTTEASGPHAASGDDAGAYADADAWWGD